MNSKIIDHLNKHNYDIRISRNARFMDQKVTPDVLCIIADCILQFVGDNDRTFTTRDIWESPYAEENVKDIFNKPDVLNSNARSEYDKFFAQPLKMLSYSGVLREVKKGSRNIYNITNRELLQYISIRERNSLNFITLYLEKVLKDSNIWSLFERFFNENNPQEFSSLKSQYEDFIIENTEIGEKTTRREEPRRIFTKILNPLCYIKKLHGTKGGSFSRDIIDYDELMYNRKNWRDTKKKKGETRIEYKARAKDKVSAFKKFSIEKAKRLIRERHQSVSEVQDNHSQEEATQVHHIFPKQDYLSIDSYLENLILLTPNQHFLQAHPKNRTREINRDYQKICLVSKLVSIRKSVEELQDGFYSKEDFVFVLNHGLEPETTFNKERSFGEIKNKICSEYSS